MTIETDQVVNDIKKQLDAVGMTISSPIIKLIINSEHALLKEYLADGHDIVIDGVCTSRVKRRNYRDINSGKSMPTLKIESDINSSFRSELMFNKKLSGD